MLAFLANFDIDCYLVSVNKLSHILRYISEYYYIDYEKIDEEKLGSSNKYQKSYIDEDGNLIIVIDSREICF